MISAKPTTVPPISLFFTIRLWQEEIRPGIWEWRGKVQHVLTGEARYFRTRTQLLAVLQELMPTLTGNGHDVDTDQ